MLGYIIAVILGLIFGAAIFFGIIEWLARKVWW